MPIGRTASDYHFKFDSYPEPGKNGFSAAFPLGGRGPGREVQANTTYAEADIPFKPHLNEGWSAYVSGETEEAEPGWRWLRFYPAIPTYPALSEGIDPIFGRTLIFSYKALKSAVRPDVGDEIPATAGAVYLTLNSGGNVTLNAGGNVELQDVRVVRGVEVRDLNQNLCEVAIITVASASAVITEWEKDDDTGTTYAVVKTYQLQATGPGGASVGADGRFTTVQRLEHNLWLSTNRPVSTLPQSRDAAVPFDGVGSIVWPAVLVGNEFTIVVSDDDVSYEKLWAQKLRAAYAGDVRTTTRRWWQNTPPTIEVPPQMLPDSIKVNCRTRDFPAIEPCLHGRVTIEEHNLAMIESAGLGWVQYNTMMQWVFDATTLTDWPETVPTTAVTPWRGGGYYCEEVIYHRPTDYNASLLTVARRAPTPDEITFHV